MFFAPQGITESHHEQEKYDALLERTERLEQTNASLQDRVRQLEKEESKKKIPGSQNRLIAFLAEMKLGATFTLVTQGNIKNVDGSNADNNPTAAYRADVFFQSPEISRGGVASSFHVHLRGGQGEGITDRVEAFSGPNDTAFQLTGANSSNASLILAEAFYQANIAMGSRSENAAKKSLSLLFGKLDSFALFDANNYADDEILHFLSSSFVHNAIWNNTVATQIGSDEYGFSPGIYAAYTHAKSELSHIRLSAGLFGAGEGASFGSDTFHAPFWVVQLEAMQNIASTLEGNYRLYFWQNQQGTTFMDNQTAKHHGVGISIDQQITKSIALFSRLGYAKGKNLPVDKTVSLGAEIRNIPYRSKDRLGIAWSGNGVSNDFRDTSTRLLEKWEHVFEIYYKIDLHEILSVSPDFQYIINPAGVSNEQIINVGIRATVSI